MAKLTAVEYKQCSKCGNTYPLSEFYSDRSRNDGLTRYCKGCHCKSTYQSKQRRYPTPEARRELHRKYFIPKTYGISVEEYDEMFKAQNGLCAICRNPETEMWRNHVKTLAVDHCHETGAVRGLLCSACNTGIGRLGDSIDHVRAALVYLLEHQNRTMTP